MKSAIVICSPPAVAVGTANFHNPYATVEIIKGIEEYMQANGVDDINTLIGCVK
jgi:dihydroorotate dehydrogenase (NAD+) catalytic subunit